MSDRPETDRTRSVPVAEVLTREGRDDPAVKQRAERPRRIMRTAAGAAVFVGAVWGLHDQVTPDRTGVDSRAAATPFTERADPPDRADAALAGPRVATGQFVTTQTPEAPPRAPAPDPAPQASGDRGSPTGGSARNDPARSAPGCRRPTPPRSSWTRPDTSGAADGPHPARTMRSEQRHAPEHHPAPERHHAVDRRTAVGRRARRHRAPRRAVRAGP
ncbi:hypothetical protein ACOBQX_06525 [Actinokineospora sp. G85]|uniref:hypothetical protein n=1 Tax=Actinokineospora sp. G85 TaxID=3406626 RepID=UPI003C7081DF